MARLIPKRSLTTIHQTKLILAYPVTRYLSAMKSPSSSRDKWVVLICSKIKIWANINLIRTQLWMRCVSDQIKFQSNRQANQINKRNNCRRSKLKRRRRKELIFKKKSRHIHLVWHLYRRLLHHIYRKKDQWGRSTRSSKLLMIRRSDLWSALTS